MNTRQGRLTVSLQDRAIGKRLYCKRQFEFDLVTRVLFFLRERGWMPAMGQGTVMDVGANLGVISIGMLVNGEVASAVALEPEPRNFDLLRQNVVQNHLEERCRCFPYAASNETGPMHMALNSSNYGDHRVLDTGPGAGSGPGRVVEVRGIRIDDLFLEHDTSLDPDAIDLMWVDVQGHEGFVFQGASALLERPVPVVSEVWPYGMRRAGMSAEDFCEIAGRFWPRFWETASMPFREHPIDALPEFMSRFRGEDEFENVLFVPMQ